MAEFRKNDAMQRKEPKKNQGYTGDKRWSNEKRFLDDIKNATKRKICGRGRIQQKEEMLRGEKMLRRERSKEKRCNNDDIARKSKNPKNRTITRKREDATQRKYDWKGRTTTERNDIMKRKCATKRCNKQKDATSIKMQRA